MTKEYVQMVGRMAYLWGWALVDNANRNADFSKAPEPGLIGGVVPIAHNAVAMLTGYISATQRIIACANQDVAYGAGFLDNLDNAPIVFQVPDFGDRFWVYALYDARTDQLSNIGKQYGTKPGFYMLVGPNWKGETPKEITAVLRSSTTVAKFPITYGIGKKRFQLRINHLALLAMDATETHSRPEFAPTDKPGQGKSMTVLLEC
jgi:hypothetical protein